MGTLSNIIRGFHVRSTLRTFRTPLGLVKIKNETLGTVLNLPEKPKKPPTPYTKFLREIKDSWRSSSTENFLKYGGKKWSSLSESEKSKYSIGYEEELSEYRDAVSTYYSNLSKDEKKLLSLIKRRRDNRKPKRPGGIFYMFVQDMVRRPEMKDMSMKEKFVACGNIWRGLPDAGKEKYKKQHDAAMEKYKRSVEEWEVAQDIESETLGRRRKS